MGAAGRIGHGTVTDRSARIRAPPCANAARVQTAKSGKLRLRHMLSTADVLHYVRLRADGAPDAPEGAQKNLGPMS